MARYGVYELEAVGGEPLSFGDLHIIRYGLVGRETNTSNVAIVTEGATSFFYRPGLETTRDAVDDFGPLGLLVRLVESTHLGHQVLRLSAHADIRGNTDADLSDATFPNRVVFCDDYNGVFKVITAGRVDFLVSVKVYSGDVAVFPIVRTPKHVGGMGVCPSNQIHDQAYLNSVTRQLRAGFALMAP